MDANHSSNVQLDLRFGHGDGFTEFAFTPESFHLLTGGVDGECRLWNHTGNGQYSEDAESFSVGDAIYGVVCDKQNFYVATETLDVKSYDLSNGNYEGSLVKFTAEVYCIAMSPDLTTVAAGSGDFKIKLVTVKDHSIKILRGHTAPILSVSFNPSGNLLASSSCDGSVRIWNTETSEEEHKWILNHPPTADRCYTNTQARISWNPVDGSLLAIPSADQIKVFKRLEANSWKLVAASKSQPTLITVASLTAFSSTGSLLALACGETGNIAIWHQQSLSSSPLAVMVREESIPVTAMVFHPKEKDVLVFADTNGKYGLLKIEKISSHRETLDSLVDDLCDKESSGKNESQIHPAIHGDLTSTSTDQVTNDVDMKEMTSDDITSQDETSSAKKSEEKSIHRMKSVQESSDDDDDDDETIKIVRKRTSFINEEADEKNASESDEDGNDALDAADFINDEVDESESDKEKEKEGVNENTGKKNDTSKGPVKGKDDESVDDFDDGSTFNEEDMIAALAEIEDAPSKSTTTTLPSRAHSESVVKEAIDTADVDFDDDMNVTDIGALKAQYEKLINPEEDDTPALDVDATNKLPTAGDTLSSKVVKVESYTQPPFQPGSTPLVSESRFMLWNEIGIVKAYSGENGADDTIEVVFHDHSIHHSINLDNRLNYTIASLSAESFVLATQYDESAVDDDTNSSKVLCMNFTAWDGRNKEWNVTLPDDEYVEALAIGTGFIAIASDKRYLRLFTIGGTQTYILSIAGSVVCLSASENSLMIVYNAAAGYQKNNPSLSAMLIKVNAKSAYPMKQPLSNPIPLALTPNCTLYWAGFTDEGTPCIVDTAGVVRLLKTHFGNCWMPIVNMKEDLTNKCDNYFVISVSEIQQNVRCLFCKGSRYPSMFPYPSLTNVPFVLPFISRGSNRGALEERAGRAKLFTSLLDRLYNEGKDVESALEENYRIHSTALLGLFTLALTNNCESLALEIANLMPSGQDVFTAIQCAVGKRCMALANKLRQVALEKDSEAKDYEEQQQAAAAAAASLQDETYHVSPKKSVVPEINEQHAPVLKPKKIESIKEKKKQIQDVASSSSSSSASSSPARDVQSDEEAEETRANESDRENQPTKSNRSKRRREDDDFINDASSDDDSDANDDENQSQSNIEKKKKEATGSRKKTSGKKKVPVVANPFEAAKCANKRKAESTAGFQLFFQEKLSQIQDESGMDDEEDCRLIAIDMFKELTLAQRNEWETKAQSKSSKKAKR